MSNHHVQMEKGKRIRHHKRDTEFCAPANTIEKLHITIIILSADGIRVFWIE